MDNLLTQLAKQIDTRFEDATSDYRALIVVNPYETPFTGAISTQPMGTFPFPSEFTTRLDFVRVRNNKPCLAINFRFFEEYQLSISTYLAPFFGFLEPLKEMRVLRLAPRRGVVDPKVAGDEGFAICPEQGLKVDPFDHPLMLPIK